MTFVVAVLETCGRQRRYAGNCLNLTRSFVRTGLGPLEFAEDLHLKCDKMADSQGQHTINDVDHKSSAGARRGLAKLEHVA